MNRFATSSAPSNSTPCEDLVLAVADAKGVSPMALPPLNDVIDPDALDTIVNSFDGEEPSDRGRVTFTYSGYTVVVDGDGEVSVTESHT